MSSTIQLPNGVTPIYLVISQWHGKRVLKSSYLGLDYELDKDLAHLGNVSMIKPELLKKFRNLANAANAVLQKYGVRFGDGYIVPNVKHKEIIEQLKVIQTEWYATKLEIISRYKIYLSKWANEAESKREGFGKIVLENAYDISYIDSQIQFEIKTATDMVSGLEKTLIDEVSDRFADKQNQLIERKKKKGSFAINRRDLIVLRDVQDKLLVNAMLSDKALPLVHYIESFLIKVPDDKDALTDDFCTEYVQVISTLVKPELIYGLNEKKDDSCQSLILGIDNTFNVQSNVQSNTQSNSILETTIEEEKSIVNHNDDKAQIPDTLIDKSEFDMLDDF
ncbi:hypothetical protein C9J21_17900 [Photobacterium phosphoreum]|uniref:DUF3150 domain-containing protein n=1 Tax=Photobacterium phosphoreum TaxID=659 RepID=UPI000D1560A5|nr:DUF3150 domain-containing protein [Photobacterium phosphoreum]PSW31223.1 hypothetical protein C9J21_17900 [Photobacterium phosphoreum]